ncbi:hypothetical protein HanIR_Chr10g0496881 [Helianthus annuus]|nr:hypothetical protein HanIR_Chr10g0496881 [Helianthus annuus]
MSIGDKGCCRLKVSVFPNGPYVVFRDKNSRSECLDHRELLYKGTICFLVSRLNTVGCRELEYELRFDLVKRFACSHGFQETDLR